MAFETIFNRPSDNVAPEATWTVETGTAEATYGVDRLIDGNPASLFKSPDTQLALEAAFDVKQVIVAIAVIHPTLEIADDVVLQADNGTGTGSPGTANWGAPDFEQVLTPLGWFGSGVKRWPLNLFALVTGAYDPAGYFFYRLALGLTTPLAQPFQCGGITLEATIRRLSPDLRWDYVPIASKRAILNTTAFDVDTIYPRGVTRWRLQADLLNDDAQETELEAHWYDADGVGYPFLVVPSPPGAGQVDVMAGRANRAYLCRYADGARPTPHLHRDMHGQRLVVDEVSRGLRPGV